MPFSRRTFLKLATAAAAAPAVLTRAALAPSGDEEFLDELQLSAFRYFAEQTDPKTGLIAEAARVDGGIISRAIRPNASNAVTGFGLAVLCAGAERGWMPRPECSRRIVRALRTLADRSESVRGWNYHWLNLQTGLRNGAAGPGGISEISTVDHAFLLAGALTARECFPRDGEIVDLVDRLYRRTDFPWLQEPSSLQMGHGWTPEHGFIASRWDEYSEAGVLYLLGLGAPTLALKPESWAAWRRDPNTYKSYHYIGNQPLFTNQYSHAFVDFRGRPEDGASKIDWFMNSRVATQAHRQFCIDLAPEFPGYTPNLWGITSSESRHGYKAWGGPPRTLGLDGSIVPAAAGGSIMFEPELCLAALRAIMDGFGERVYCRYGFVDAFHPLNGWVSPYVKGLDAGITFLAAENLRTGLIWKWFTGAKEIQRALSLAKLTLQPSLSRKAMSDK